MDIYSILSSKPHNPHYLSRYITFIHKCQQNNVYYDGYIENHHICPKAEDMFPEYKDFRKHSWNKAALTGRQHLIAHLILCKTFPNIFSVVEAYWHMSNYNGRKINSKLFGNLRERRSSNISVILSGKPKKYDKETLDNFRKSLTGKVFVYDENGSIIQISNKDQRFTTGVYKHYLKNKVPVKIDSTTIIWIEKDNEDYLNGSLKHVFAGLISVKDSHGNFYKVSSSDPRYLNGEFVGVVSKTAMVKDDTGKIFRISVDNVDYINGKYKPIIENNTPAKDKFGNTFWAHKDDPRFASGEIFGITKDTVTVKDKNGNKFRVNVDDPRYLSGEFVGVSKGGKWYNNGVIAKVFMEDDTITQGFIPGMLKRNKN